MAIGEAKIALPERVASYGETTVLVLPLEANLGLLRRALPSSEAKITSLLAPSGTLSLALRQRSLALSALVLASRLRTFLAFSVVSGSDVESAILLAHRGALDLTSRDKRG